MSLLNSRRQHTTGDYSKTAITSGGSVNLTSTDGNIGSDSPDNALVVSGTGKVNADAYNIYLTV